MLPTSVVEMVKSVADKCLLSPVENRDEIELTFAKVVGQAVQTALEGLQKAHKDAIDEAATEEENGLQPKKDLMESDLSALKEVKDTVRGPSNPGKKALKEVEAPQSLIAGIGEAIGKKTPFDQNFVAEAAKLLYEKSAQIEGELAKFSETVTEYAEKTKDLTAKAEQLSTDLTERDTELVAAKKKQKDCIAAIKESEKQKKQGDKSLEKAISYKDEKALAENVGTEAEV